ncbi:MAG TPA: hypoxanthine phosphoribosyltransferase [Ignavibacteria bacterium]|nr:hypoxanthine phosphoribosyltransferase [Ignavibacteria bacterium]
METVNEAKLTKFISAEEISDIVRDIASRINADYKGRNPILIGVLNGAFVFLSDLIRELDIECEIDFLKLSSYGNEKISSGDVTILKELNCNPEGRDIIIIEDIVDTGASIEFIKKLLEKENPASVRFATLLYKSSKCNLDFEIDYKGFEIEDRFCVGYGMDWAQKYRNLKDIYVL